MDICTKAKVVLNKENANSVLLNSDMRGYNLETQNTADYSLILEQKLNFIVNGLSLKATSSFVNYFQNYVRRDIDERYIPTWKPNLNQDGTVSFFKNKDLVLPNNGTSQNKNRKEYYELALNYEFSTIKHKVTALLLGNAEKTNYQYSRYYFTPRSYLGFVGRVTYNYGNKYLAEINAGYNGSENFAEGKRFGIFPSLSFGWTFSEEQVIKNLVSSKILSYGKIRFSYGIVGNDKLIDPWQNPLRFLYLPGTAYMNNYSYNGWWESGGPNFGLPGSINSNPVAYQGIPGNPNVTWETAVKVNYGIDLSFIDGKLKASFDYFTDDRQDILIEQNVVPVYQETGKLPLNLGKHSNRGYEIQLGWNSNINQDSRIWAEASYTFARNKMEEIDEPKKLYDYQMQTGRRIGEIWGFQQEGIIMTDEEAIAYREQLWNVYQGLNPSANFANYKAYQLFSGSDVAAGDLKYTDRNGDGVINDNDQGYLNIVNFPESMFALNLGYQYKGFSVSTLWQGASNFAINIRGYYMPSPIRGSMRDFMLNRYTRERYEAGEQIDYPSLTNAHNNWEKLGSFWYRDASYVRLKSMEVGYTFKTLKRFGFDELMLYVNGMNLFTISNIETLDPETRDGQITYPRSRIFNIGVRAQF
ncbi:MAG: SusC/RagA family TonB-linked outer membrane protein [Bacteroidetes bacterium]|nr:SusC/RagA family TonB-linked outer membrane protein [Bacteroidota bacterium]